MKVKLYSLLLLLSVGNSIICSSEERQWHYFDMENKPLPQCEPVYDKLNAYFKENVPEKMIVEFTTLTTSRFDLKNKKVLISENHAKNDFIGVVAHESCHLSLANLTKNASIKEDFRFLDEGFANIFQEIITNTVDYYKNEALATAAVQSSRNNVSFEKVQKWSVYYGNPPLNTTFYAKLVGSSFDFFIIDTFGMENLFAFFKDLGQSQDLDKSFENVFKTDIQNIESKWLEYLKNVKFTDTQPHIVKMFPANQATKVNIKTSEIYVEFEKPMDQNIILITNCNDAINYKNAYWLTDKILAVKVNLLPDFQYKISLGDEIHGRFVSKTGSELPITLWSFTTDSK